jgi:PKD repeat protein
MNAKRRIFIFTRTLLAALVMSAWCSSSKAQCISSFNYTNNGSGNLSFAYTGTFSTHTWSFSGGSPGTSTLGNPSVTYTANGNYTVVMSVSNASPACSFTYSQVITIGNASCALAPNFSWTPGPNGSIQFLNSSVGTTSFATFNWSFGNNTSSSAFSPSVTYATNSVYPVVLTVSNSPTCFATYSTYIVVTNACGLTAGFNYSQTASNSISFINTSTGTNSSVSYTWNFGNTSTSTANSPSHFYATGGNYTVSLVATNTVSGCSSTFTLQVPVCSLSFTSASAPAGQMNFTANAAPSASTSGFSWQFGNGGSAQGGPSFSQVAASYTSNGTYTVILTYTSNAPACNLIYSDTVSVLNSTCALNANFSYTTGGPGTIVFQNLTTGTTVSTSFFWQFGDTDTDTTASPTHSYNINGSYVVTLTAVNQANSLCVSTHTMLIVVGSVPCNATFTATSGPNGNVVFNTFGSAPSGTATTYAWTFGNGSTATLSGFSPSVSTSYTANGTYTVTLQLTAPGCTTSVTHTVLVSNVVPCPLNPGFIYSNGFNGAVNLQSSTSGTTSATTYTWLSSAGNANGNSSTLTFSASGNYPVTLIVSNNSQPTCTASITQTIQVTVVPCSLQAAISHTQGTGGLVQFQSVSSGTVPGASYLWDFGDGQTALGNTVSHQYSNGGTHYVSLGVANALNCTDSITQAINITGVTCVANSGFSLLPTQVPQHWIAYPSYPWNVTAATWQWGDGSSNNSLYASHQYSAAGSYDICLTVTASCGASSGSCLSYSVYKQAAGIIYVNVMKPPSKPVGIEEAPESQVYRVWPNPCSGDCNIDLPAAYAGSLFEIMDLNGRVLLQRATDELPGDARKQVRIDLPDGIYLAVMRGKEQIHIQKLIIYRD